MQRLWISLILCIFSAHAADNPGPPDPGGVLKEHTLAAFGGSGQNSIQSIATDTNGNIYVAGTTSSPDLPVLNAIQPKFGDARILRTTDLGVTWTPVASPPTDVDVVVQDPITQNVLFAAGNSGIFKTVDGGATWRLVRSYTPTYTASHPLVLDPGNHLRLAAVSPDGQFIRSLDGGETWAGGAQCESSQCPIGRLWADPTGSGTLLGASFGPVISRDWGVTFQLISLPSAGGIIAVAFDPSHPGWIYAAASAGVAGGLWLSTDYGTTWISKSVPATTFSSISTLVVDHDQPNTLVAVTPDGLYKSTDGASSWTRQTVSPGSPTFFSISSNAPLVIPRRQCAPEGGLFALGGAQQVAFSPDYGVTWKTPQFSLVSNVMAGADCAVYITRRATTDAFVAKLAPDGTHLWTTYLGGSDQDSAAALVLDSQGNAYIAGSTNSFDFPATVPRIGVRGQTNAFITKLAADGMLAYSVVLGGEASDAASALALDPQQNVYVVGRTNSAGFPVTPGALIPKADAQSSLGFIAKLTPNAALVYASYLGMGYNAPAAVLVNSNGEATVAGLGALPEFADGGYAYILRLDAAGSRVTMATPVPGSGAITLANDAAGNLFVAGVSGDSVDATPGAFQGGQRSFVCAIQPSSLPGTVYVTKLRSSDWQPVYRAVLGGQCGSRSGNMLVDSSGAVILAVSSGPGFPLHNPLLAGPSCSNIYQASAVAKLSPDGSTLQFATYLDDCGAPALGFAPDGSLIAGVTYGFAFIPPSGTVAPSAPAGLLHLIIKEPPPISLDQIANAFSGDATAVTPGGLYYLSVPGIRADFNDPGLNSPQDLPTQLGGIQVTFDGIPAPIFQTAPGWVIVVPPLDLGAFAAVQVSNKGVVSNVVLMPVSTALPGLLTRDFPNPPSAAFPDYADGNIRNQDGTLNDAAHPAAIGSTITLFVTGMGMTNPRVTPGSVAHSLDIVPVAQIFTSWNFSNSPDRIYSLQGFVSGLFQVPVTVRQPVPNPNVPPGTVQRVSIGLLLTPQFGHFAWPVSNLVGVYIK